MSRPPWLEGDGETVLLRVHVQPGAKRSEIVGRHGDSLKIRVQAPPVEGKANASLVRFLAKRLGCRRADVTIASGELSREKRIAVAGIDAAEAANLLAFEKLEK